MAKHNCVVCKKPIIGKSFLEGNKPIKDAKFVCRKCKEL